MPSLPRIRSRRAAPGAPVVETRPAPAELQAAASPGSTSSPRPPGGPASRQPLRLASARRRGRPLAAPAPEGRRLRRRRRARRLPLHRPPLPGLRRGHRPSQRRGARCLHRPGLPRHAARGRAAPGQPPLPPLRGERGLPRPALLARLGPPFYEVLDDLYDYCFPILDKIGFKLEQIDESIGEDQGRASLVTDIHKVKQEIISYRKIIKPQRPTLRQLERRRARSCRRSSSSTSTTSSTRASASGICSTTTRKSWRRSRTRTSR